MENKNNPGTLAKIAEYIPLVLTLANGVKSLWASIFGGPKTEEEKTAIEWAKAVKDYRKGRRGMTWEKLQNLSRVLYPEGLPGSVETPVKKVEDAGDA